MFQGERETVRRLALLFGIALTGMLVSKGMALIPGYAFDDYSVINQPRSLEFTISQGRFTQTLLQLAVDQIDVSAAHVVWTSTIFFLVAAAVAIALGLDYATRGQPFTILLGAIAALLATYPYLTEYFTFRESLVPQGFAFGLLALILVRARREADEAQRTFFSPVTVALMVLLAGCQQTTFIVAVLFYLGRFVLDLERGFTAAWALNSRALKTTLLSGAIYAVLAFSSMRLLTSGLGGDARGTILGAEQIPQRIGQVTELAFFVLFKPEPTVSAPIKFGVLACLLAGILLGISRSPKLAMLWLGSWCVMFSMSLFLVSIGSVWWPVPRAIYASVFASSVLLAVMFSGRARFLSKVAAFVIGACAVASAMKSNQILVDQQRLNRWDMWTAAAIYEEATRQGFADHEQLRLIGAGWSHPGRLGTIQGDLNASALMKTWAVAGVFREATGRELRVSSQAADPSICGGKPTWPARGALFRSTSEFVVCMK